MAVFHFIFIIAIFIIGLILKSKKIKDIKFHKISIFYILIILYILVTLIDLAIIIPFPNYYIKSKDHRYIETIIEDEMTKSNIEYDQGSLIVVNRFIGKYNQLYLSTYEVDGEERARMFDFDVSIFGNLKPSYDFIESNVILKDELDDGINYRIVRDGIPSFYISYGYSNNPEEINYSVGKFVVQEIKPEGYYIIVTRDDAWSPFGFELIFFGILLTVMHIKEKKKLTYTETKVIGKFLFEIEYFV